MREVVARGLEDRGVGGAVRFSGAILLEDVVGRMLLRYLRSC